jgi:AcrR family transcriptional regulator
MKQLTKRQEQIVTASLEIISESGIQGLTIRNLAKKIGVTDGAIYRHFTGKEEILGTISERFKSSSTEILNELMSQECTSIQKIKHFFLGRCKQFDQDQGLVLVLFSEDIFKKYKYLQKEVHSTIQSHQELLVKAIKEGQQLNIISNHVKPNHIFMLVMGSLRLLVSKWRLSQFQFDLMNEGEELWSSIETLISQENN